MGTEGKFARLAAAAAFTVVAAAETPVQAQTTRDYELERLTAEYEQRVDRDIGNLQDSIRRYDRPDYYDMRLVANIARRTSLVVPNCTYDPRQPHRVLPTGEQFLGDLSPRVFTTTSTRAGWEMLSEEYGEFERACRSVYEDGQQLAQDLLELQERREREGHRN